MRAASAFFAAILALGCAARATGPLPGVSSAEPDSSPPSRPQPPKPAEAWDDFALARQWPEAAPAVPALGHRHAGALVRVRVEPRALEPYQALAVESPMPEGARVVAFYETPEGALLAAYVLEKRGGSWQPSLIDPRGAKLETDTAACLRCHVQSPTDGLFGVSQRSEGQGAPARVAPASSGPAPAGTATSGTAPSAAKPSAP